MSSYKLGNKVTGIIRACSPGKLGNMIIEYSNQPYTIVYNTEAQLSFDSRDKEASSNIYTDLYYNNDRLDTILLKDIELNDKILSLIFDQNEDCLCHQIENYESDEAGIVYLNKPTDTIYQVFIYDNEGKLEKAFGTLTEDTITLEKRDASYLIVYSYLGELSFKLDKPSNQYLSLDLIVTGNENDETSKMFIHAEKCGLQIDKSMYFNQRANTVDLTFKVIDTKENYITVK